MHTSVWFLLAPSGFKRKYYNFGVAMVRQRHTLYASPLNTLQIRTPLAKERPLELRTNAPALSQNGSKDHNKV